MEVLLFLCFSAVSLLFSTVFLHGIIRIAVEIPRIRIENPIRTFSFPSLATYVLTLRIVTGS